MRSTDVCHQHVSTTSTHCIVRTPNPGRLAPLVFRGAFALHGASPASTNRSLCRPWGVVFPGDDDERSPASDASVTAPFGDSIAFARELPQGEAEVVYSARYVKERGLNDPKRLPSILPSPRRRLRDPTRSGLGAISRFCHRVLPPDDASPGAVSRFGLAPVRVALGRSHPVKGSRSFCARA
jgi:hypothetical protein